MEELNLYQKLAKIRKQVEVIQKDKQGYNYKYVSEDTILAKITVFMDKYAVSLIPGIVPSTSKVEPLHTLKTKFNKKGEVYEEHVNDILVSGDMCYTWVNNDHPEERIEVPWFFVGQKSEDASQSFGSGLTYSSRYFLLKYFNVATPQDDPDNWRGKQQAAAADENKMITEEIIKRIDETVRLYLADHPDESETVKKFISLYAKGGNYKSIKEPAIASKLLAEFKSNFSEKEVA